MISSATRLVLLASAFFASSAASRAQLPTPNPKLLTLFVVGDLPPTSFADLFDATHLNLQSSPASGRTTRAYINSGDWDKLLGQVKPGDFVLIEFAPTTLSPADKFAATRTLQGIGDGTFDYLDPGTQKLELVHSYGWYLRRMVVDTISHGASPILCSTPATSGQTAAISPDNAEPADAQSTAAAWTRAIATEQRVLFVDLTAGPAPTPDTLKAALYNLQPDPLAPYLKH